MEPSILVKLFKAETGSDQVIRIVSHSDPILGSAMKPRARKSES